MSMQKEFPIWKTIQIGGKSEGAPITELPLIRVSVRELDLPEGETTQGIWYRAAHLRLGQCPAEVDAHLLLADDDKPDASYYLLRMLVEGCCGDPPLFSIVHVDGGRKRGGHAEGSYRPWGAGDQFVFVAPGT